MTYPTTMPEPEGMANRPDDMTSWKFRREYAWSIVDNSASAASWWDATGWTYSNPTYNAAAYSAGTGLDSIVCAINNFGQDDVVKMAPTGASSRAYNGYCIRGPRYNTQGWQQVWHVTKCNVAFGAPATTKRDGGVGEGFDERWEVKSECPPPLYFSVPARLSHQLSRYLDSQSWRLLLPTEANLLCLARY